MNIIFCATKFEIFGFLRKLKILKKTVVDNCLFYSCLFENKKKVTIVITGIGSKAADTACRHLLAQIDAADDGASNNAGRNIGIYKEKFFDNDMGSKPKRNASSKEHNIIITGFAGSLKESLKVGDVALISEVVEMKKNYIVNGCFCFVVSGRIKIKNSILNKMFLEETDTDGLLESRSGRNIFPETICATVNEVINNNSQKLSVFQSSGADIMDMETYPIIKNLKNLKNKSFLCLRTISDDREHNLPDLVNFFLNKDSCSGFKIFPLHYYFSYLKGFFKCFAFLLLKPANIRSFFRFLKNVSLAEKTLSMAMEKLIRNAI